MDIIFIKMIDFSANIFESILTIEYITKMNESRSQGIEKQIYMAIVFILLMINAEIFGSMRGFSEFMSYIALAIAIIYSLIAFTGKVTFKVFSCVVIIVVIIMVNFLTILIFGFIFNVTITSIMNENSVYRLACIMISKIILFLVTRIILNFKTKYISSIPSETLVLTIFVPVMTIAVAVLITEASISLTLTDRNIFYLMISLVGMIIINIVFYLLLMRLNKAYNLQAENKLFEQKYNMQLDYVKRTQDLYDEIRIMRHDMKSHIIYLKDLFSGQNHDKGIIYADNLITKIDSMPKLIYTGRAAFDAILNAKMHEASLKGISFEYSILCSMENIMEDGDMVSLLGNVIDNAIEACEHVQEKKRLYFEVKKEQGYLIFIIKNPIAYSVKKNNPKLNSTKKDKEKHGFGIKSIEKIAEKYKGKAIFDEKNYEFICKIMILI